ncbi:hypothetical protein L228DRAFT_251448 [Xylona heveae TC161]|uniref:Uncharacterized protein n=1 Tax=Xylona heveae (strain CBS 132557 / TC161) TaxID=1328760 RepID=A0A164ZC69_XYLHT|nr:hypothetical protein L228DRAFT_251448 [Xylona heveae TC161]KZF18922.1 hypothetical protein L228DRAFT_251448 [Xylona heveae TC161]
MREGSEAHRENLWLFSILTVYFGESIPRTALQMKHGAILVFFQLQLSHILAALGSPRNESLSLLIGEWGMPG